jgi:hypothetical protein
MAVENWDTNEALNGTIEGENVAEGSLPGDLNDVVRKMCAAVKVFYNKAYRKNETIKATAAGAADPFSTHAEDDVWIEYTP